MTTILNTRSSVERKNVVNEAVKQYFNTTTLHGFKYLCSTNYIDRLGWLLCCCASACCSGLLCAVLWERFMEVPAVLTLGDKVREQPIDEQVPDVFICPPAESVAEMFMEKLLPLKNDTHRVPIAFDRLLSGKRAAKEQLMLLENILSANDVTLPEVMMNYSPACNAFVKKCRYQDMMIPCGQLFEKILTKWGLCCVMRADKLLTLRKNQITRSRNTQVLDYVLQCTHGSKLYGCQLITMYEHEEKDTATDILLSGYYYGLQLRFAAIPENEMADHLVKSSCETSKRYSRTFCLLRCAEEWCGCSDPLQGATDLAVSDLPMCPVTQIECLRNKEYTNNMTCDCLPPCKIITSYELWESNKMDLNDYTVIDPIYSGLNVTSSIVLSLRINVDHSRILVLNPTETWLTLLSSLGGVFNIFLGVGLFSALEFLFFIIIKLPAAIRKSSEIEPINTYSAPIRRF